jgi:hypothetical protein
MIVIQLTGGLGNQMFQYATAYVVAKNLNTSLKVDSKEFMIKRVDINFTRRDFELGIFNLKFETVNPLIWKVYRKLSAIFSNFDIFLAAYLIKVYAEQSLSFEERLFKVSGNNYLCGYFQSEKYFGNYRKDLLKLFEFKVPLNGKNKEIAAAIKKTNSVSVHIRRGDYVSNKQINSIHGTVGLKYYNKAIALLKEKMEKPVFYFFSDDVEWVMENFKLNSQVIVCHNSGSQSYIDMQLMTYCKHNIIANSSFSWWGAWLNSNPEKIIIAPSKWYEEPTRNLSTVDMIPSGWIRLSED